VEFFTTTAVILDNGVLGLTFVISSATTQHSACFSGTCNLSQSQKMELFQAFEFCAGRWMAASGLGYGLGGNTVKQCNNWHNRSFGFWFHGGRKDPRGCGIRSMLHFGGTVTCNSLVVYLGYNAEKILLGRFWGAMPLDFTEGPSIA